VDSEDENTFAAAWFAEIGDGEYDPDIDLNRNGEIDYGDLTLAEMHTAWNWLVKVQNEIDTGSGLSYSDVAEYEYNAMHWRTVKREGGEERRFYYSASWQLVQEDIDEDYVGSPGVDRYAQQFWGIRSIDDAAARRRVDGQSESLYFHITDG
jgi:hypothetical protein